MKTHAISLDVPLVGRMGKSVCGKDCEVLASIPTDADLQDVEIKSLVSCSECTEPVLNMYTYIAKLKRVSEGE